MSSLRWKGKMRDETNPMTVRQPRYSKEEFARRGHEIYDLKLRPILEANQMGLIVAIDIETESFEVAADSLTAAKQLLKRCPDAQILCIRIGHPAVHRFGFYTQKPAK